MSKSEKIIYIQFLKFYGLFSKAETLNLNKYDDFHYSLRDKTTVQYYLFCSVLVLLILNH